MSTVIKVENLSKLYRLGDVGTGTISHDLNRWWHRIRGKEDPYLKIGEVNDRAAKGASDYVWALKDINFEVQQGEVLGIIGKNGAGKSTLLKILSRTTAPTTGSVKIKGRVASLLEVGTGFHPELSGRDNIFLNGAILGMTRREIKSKFDEIVDFAGVERYIDTPVKRYSSGMYVRLAFAVAAHLDPEILIVDEVLAVGDAEFQKKCLGKMKDVSERQGRTVLFVSHNIAVVNRLCTKVIYLNNGNVIEAGATRNIVDKYLNEPDKKLAEYIIDSKYSNNIAYATKLVVQDLEGNESNEISIGKPWKVRVFFTVVNTVRNLTVGLGMLDIHGNPLRTSWNNPYEFEAGSYVADFLEDQITFSTGQYRFVIGLSIGQLSVQYVDDNLWFRISNLIEAKEYLEIKNTNSLILNQMKMNIDKIS